MPSPTCVDYLKTDQFAVLQLRKSVTPADQQDAETGAGGATLH